MKKATLIIIGCLLAGCSEPPEKDFLFKTLSPEVSNLEFSNELTETDNLSILYYVYYFNGGGVAIGDVNNDNLQDIYFTGNQVSNKLFLNQGNMRFKDITKNAGVAGSSDWNTGVTMADVNGDGLLDIYTSAVVGINGLKGKNELFINNGDLTFTEDAKSYGLDIQNYATTSAFFDYDNDGDLDMYLLNQAVHTVNSYGPANIRNKRNPKSGDKLFQNNQGKFTDVSAKAGIYGGANGYGLGLATADFNNDGYTDIYVSNDFHEDDYYYLNNGDGTFSESLKSKFGHVSRFSMGNDVADVNQDGYVDILTVDMLPKNEEVLKASMSDDALDLYNLKVSQLGYHHQYARNMLQLNQGGAYFQEVGLLTDLAATDWSWAPLFSDYDLDGTQDIFIATGIPRRPNNLDYIKYISNEQIQQKFNSTTDLDQEALEMMPSGEVPNYMFKGQDNLKFLNQSGKWISSEPIISTGAAWGDLDNDGDIDLVTNNIDHPAALYQNTSEDQFSYLKIKIDYITPNPFGIGTKVVSYHEDKQQVKQLFTSRGFQSSSEPLIHFGYGKLKKVDSLLIIWPDNTFQKLYDVDLNQTLHIKPESMRDSIDYRKLFPTEDKWFKKLDSVPGLDFAHQENEFIDFDRQKLIPYQISDRGPAVAVKDLNGDGKEDIFFGSSKLRPSKIYLQSLGGFKETGYPSIVKDSITEDVSAVIEDFDQDGINDLFIVSAGGEFNRGDGALADRLYLQGRRKEFEKVALPPYFENGSVVKASDFDKNGTLDLFIGGAAVTNDFGRTPHSFLLKNDGTGNFEVVLNEALKEVGMVTDAVWTDFNRDGWQDLIVVGEWMTPEFFKNDKGNLQNVTADFLAEDLSGLWQSIIPHDINSDGEMDYLIGNWGLNTKFKASAEKPLKMFYSDFDKNGSTETVLAYEKDGKYYTVLGLDELAGQLSYLRKRFSTYEEFAGTPLKGIFTEKELSDATVFNISTMASGYLLNKDGKFTFEPFATSLQIAPITSFLKADFNKDKKQEVLVGGNYFGVTPYHGRFDGLAGNLITSDGIILEGNELGLNLAQKVVRGLDIVHLNDTDILMVTFNDDKPAFYEIR